MLRPVFRANIQGWLCLLFFFAVSPFMRLMYLEGRDNDLPQIRFFNTLLLHDLFCNGYESKNLPGL